MRELKKVAAQCEAKEQHCGAPLYDTENLNSQVSCAHTTKPAEPEEAVLTPSPPNILLALSVQLGPRETR